MGWFGSVQDGLVWVWLVKDRLVWVELMLDVGVEQRPVLGIAHWRVLSTPVGDIRQEVPGDPARAPAKDIDQDYEPDNF